MRDGELRWERVGVGQGVREWGGVGGGRWSGVIGGTGLHHAALCQPAGRKTALMDSYDRCVDGAAAPAAGLNEMCPAAR